MKHENFQRGIQAVRANATGNPAQILNEMSEAFASFRKRQDGEVRELKAGLDDANQAIAALNVGGGGGWSPDGVSEHNRPEVNNALRRLIRDGDGTAMASLQSVNAGMSSDSEPDGGFTMIPYLSPVMTQRLREISPMRQLARIEEIETDTFEEIADTGEAGAKWVSEREARGDTASPTLHKLRVNVHEISAMPKVTQRLLDDSTFDLATWLTRNIAQSFAQKEGNAFISGDGVGKPRGILSYDTTDDDDDTRAWGTLQTIPTGKADGFLAPTTSVSPADALVDVTYSIKPEYRAGATWLLNRKTASVVRKFKNPDGQFIWVDSIAAGEPARLLGFPVQLDEEMPDVAAGETPIAFGDFASGYVIVDRTGLRLLRDPFTDKPNVRFYTTKRVGGAVFNSEAIKLLRVGT